MAESSSNKEISIVLEVKLSGIHESFDVTVEPGSYVSELIAETLEQCNVTNVKPENYQLLLLSKTTVLPLEDEDLFNSISTVLDERSKLLLKEVESNTHILKVFFHERDDYRIKYSFIVDETTTADIINKSMATKLRLNEAQHDYRLINCVPAGEDYELQPNDIPLLMTTNYLEFRIYEKSPSLKLPSKATSHSLKQLKKQTKQKKFTLPSPPSVANRDQELLSPIATSTSLSPTHFATARTLPLPPPPSNAMVTVSRSMAVQTNTSRLTSSAAVPTSGNQTTGKVLPISYHDEDATELSARNERIIQSLESELAKQYEKVHAVETKLKEANSSLQAKNEHMIQYKAELENIVAEKQQAIDTLSDLLQSEQDENELLRNDPLKLSVSLYQDLAVGRIGLALELEAQDATTHSENFTYKEVAAPISCNGSYIVVNKVKPGFNKLVVGDIILEVNGFSCREVNTDRAIQILEECGVKRLQLVIARSQPSFFDSNDLYSQKLPLFSSPRLVSTDILNPSPSSPAPTSASTDSLDTPAPQFPSTDSLDPPPLPSTSAPQFPSTDSLDPPPLPSTPAPQFPSTDSLDPPPLPSTPAPQFPSTDDLDPPPLPSTPAPQFPCTDSLDHGPPPLPSTPAPQFPSTDDLDCRPLPSFSIDVPNEFSSKRNIDHVNETMALQKEIKYLQSVVTESKKREKEFLKEMELAKRENSDMLAQAVQLDKLLKDERHEKEKYAMQFIEAESINSNMTQELSHLQNQLHSESAKLERLEEDNKSLQDRLVEVSESFDSNKLRYMEELKDMKGQLKEKEEKLSEVLLANKMAKTSSSKKYEDNLTSAQRELDEIKRLSKKKEEELEAKLQAIKLENDQILSDENEVKEANEKMAVQFVNIQQQLESVTIKHAEINKKAQELEKDLEGLKEEKISLVKEIENKNTAHEQQEREYLNQKEKELERMKFDHQKVIHEKERELENAKKDKMSLEVKVQTLEALRQERLSSLESDLDNSRKQSNRKEDTIAEKDDRISQLHFSLKELTLEQQKDIQQRMKQLVDTQQELLVYKEKAHILEADKILQQEKLASLENDMQVLKMQSEKRDNTIAEKDSQIAELHLSLKEVNAELRASQKQVFNEKERLVEFTEKAEKMKIELAKSEVEEDKLKQQVLELKQKNENIVKECDSIKNEKNMFERKQIELISELNNEREDLALEKKQLKQEIEDLTGEIQSHKSLLEVSQKESSQYKEKIEKLISTMEQDLESVKQQSDESVTEKDVVIAKLHTVVDERNAQITTLQDQLKNQTVEVNTLSESLKSASNTVTSLQSTNKELANKVQSLETENTKLSNNVEQLQKEISELKKIQEKSESLKEQLSKRNEEFQLKLQEKIQEGKTQLKVHSNKTKDLQDKIDQLTRHVSEFEGKCTMLTQELSKQKDTAQTQRVTMEAEKQEMTIKLASLEQQLLAANGELALQRNSYATLESKTNTLYEQLGYFKSDKEKIDEKFINVVQEKERLKHEFEAVKTDLIKNFDESQKQLAEKETELKHKINDLEYSKQATEKANIDVKRLEGELEQVSKEAEEKFQDTSNKHNHELKEMREEMESLHEEIKTLQRNQSSLTDQLNSSKILVESISEEKEKLNESLDELRIELTHLKKTSADDLETERNQYLANIEKLEEESKRKQAKIQEEFSKTETQIHIEQQKQLKESENSKRTLMEEVEKHKAEVAEKISEIESLNQYIARLLPVVMEYKPSVLSTKQSSLSSLRY